MAKGRRFTLVMVPHNKEGVKQLGGPLVLCCGLVLAFMFVLGVWSIGSTYVVSIFDGGKLANLENENEVLTTRLQELNALTETFETKMDQLVRREQAARVVVGLPDIHPDVREVGVGGYEDMFRYEGEPGSPEAFASSIHDKLDRLIRDVRLEKASLAAIEEKAGTDQEYWLQIPTVRPVGGPTSSPFGMRDDPFTGLRRMHPGFDIAARHGEPVRVTADGIILKTGLNVNYGLFIDVDHENGYSTRYGHLSAIDTERGAKVQRGMTIGKVGKTGRATNYHLHYEVRRNGRIVDPSAYFFPEEVVVD
ncbi:MAG: M23 family metallopeptidase [Candidatus Latescibacteria bacterium]|jgi:murein DD-endopeptidase MepM/ murein hydrolase activator NlpD|nr:M23 family metallopeptidase [Candidatus Latescibacterota bacterium]